MSIQSGELPGRMSYVAIGDGPPLVVFPGLSREANGSSTSSQAREGGRYSGLARATGRDHLCGSSSPWNWHRHEHGRSCYSSRRSTARRSLRLPLMC